MNDPQQELFTEIRQQLVRRMRRDGHIGKNIMELLVKDYRED